MFIFHETVFHNSIYQLSSRIMYISGPIYSFQLCYIKILFDHKTTLQSENQ